MKNLQTTRHLHPRHLSPTASQQHPEDLFLRVSRPASCHQNIASASMAFPSVLINTQGGGYVPRMLSHVLLVLQTYCRRIAHAGVRIALSRASSLVYVAIDNLRDCCYCSSRTSSLVLLLILV